MTFTKIATVTVGSGGQSSIDFNSVPGGMSDLLLVLNARLNSTYSEGSFLTFNSSSSGYSARDLYGNGSSAASSSNPFGLTSKLFIGSQPGNAQTSGIFGSTAVYIPNYAGNTVKSASIESNFENNATAAGIDIIGGLWTGTAAITSISITSNNGNFVQYSSATLYGITKGSLAGVTVS